MSYKLSIIVTAYNIDWIKLSTFEWYIQKLIPKPKKITIITENSYNPPFNKSALLNKGIKQLGEIKDDDCISIFDVDMIYHPNFVSIMQTLLEKYDYIVSYGHKLTKRNTDYILYRCPEFNEIESLNSHPFKGCSQITFNKKVYDILMDCFGHIYDETFCGWGGEDSDLSYKSRVLNDLGKIKKTHVYNMWYHMHHPFDRERMDKSSFNYQYFQRKKKDIENAISKYYSNNNNIQKDKVAV